MIARRLAEIPTGRISSCVRIRRLSPPSVSRCGVPCASVLSTQPALLCNATAIAAALIETGIFIAQFSFASKREHEQVAAPAGPACKFRKRRTSLAYIVRQIGGHVAG